MTSRWFGITAMVLLLLATIEIGIAVATIASSHSPTDPEHLEHIGYEKLKSVSVNAANIDVELTRNSILVESRYAQNTIASVTIENNRPVIRVTDNVNPDGRWIAINKRTLDKMGIDYNFAIAKVDGQLTEIKKREINGEKWLFIYVSHFSTRTIVIDSAKGYVEFVPVFNETPGTIKLIKKSDELALCYDFSSSNVYYNDTDGYYYVRDLSGNGNDARMEDTNSTNADGNTPPQIVPGYVGDGIRFDGTDDRTITPSNPTIQFNQDTSFTIIGFIKLNQEVPSSYYTGFGYPYQVTFTIRYNEQISFQIRYGDNHTKLYGSVLEIGKYYLVAGVYNASDRTAQLWENGVMKEQTTITHDFVANVDFRLAHAVGGGTITYLNGDMDEVRIYRRPLNDTEMKLLTALLYIGKFNELASFSAERQMIVEEVTYQSGQYILSVNITMPSGAHMVYIPASATITYPASPAFIVNTTDVKGNRFDIYDVGFAEYVKYTVTIPETLTTPAGIELAAFTYDDEFNLAGNVSGYELVNVTVANLPKKVWYSPSITVKNQIFKTNTKAYFSTNETVSIITAPMQATPESNYVNVTFVSHSPTEVKFASDAPSDEKATFEIYNLRESSRYILFVDDEPEKVAYSDANGRLSFVWLNWSEHNFTVVFSPGYTLAPSRIVVSDKWIEIDGIRTDTICCKAVITNDYIAIDGVKFSCATISNLVAGLADAIAEVFNYSSEINEMINWLRNAREINPNWSWDVVYSPYLSSDKRAVLIEALGQ